MRLLTGLLLAGLALWTFQNDADAPLEASHPLGEEPEQADGDLLWSDLEPGGDQQITYLACASPVPANWVIGIEEKWDAVIPTWDFDPAPDCSAQTVLRWERGANRCEPTLVACWTGSGSAHEDHFDLTEAEILFDRPKWNLHTYDWRTALSSHEWGHTLDLADHSEVSQSVAGTLMNGFIEDPPTYQAPTSSDLQSVLCNIYSVTGLCLANSMDLLGGDIVTASIGTSDPLGTAMAETPLSFFPREGITFLILSSGLASSAYDPNDEGLLSNVLGGLNNSEGWDLVQLTLQLQVPDPFICLAFDFAFYSDEFPEFVGTEYNDTFIAELGPTGAASTFLIVGSEVEAPNNIAFDSIGNAIDVNSVFGFSADTGTTYDGVIGPLGARSEVVPGTQIELVFSIMDLGDSNVDSSVFLDNFRWTMDPSESCQSGAVGIDDDNDDWSNMEEAYIGTDPFAACPATFTADDEPIDAWVPDFNDDRVVNSLDVFQFALRFGSTLGDGTYLPRYDMNTDGTINSLDTSILNIYFNTTCA